MLIYVVKWEAVTGGPGFEFALSKKEESDLYGRRKGEKNIKRFTLFMDDAGNVHNYNVELIVNRIFDMFN